MKNILLKYGTVYPITSPPMKGADVRIENGKIAEIGYNLLVNEKTEVIDVSGKYVFPGFIDVHTHLGLYDEGTGWAGNDANETIETMTPHVRAIDSVYPLDPGFRDAIEHGITTVHIMPGSANVIGGTTAVIKTYGKNVSKMIVKETAGLKLALGENPKRMHSQGNKESLTRMGIMGMLRETFYNAKYSDWPHDFRTIPIIQALNRDFPIRVHAHRADDILSAIRFADEFGLDLRIEHCTEGHPVAKIVCYTVYGLDLRIEHCTEGHLIAEELQGRDLQVSVGPTLTRRSKVELKNKSWKTYKILSDVGVHVSITTDHPYTPIQYLPICAAIAVREGLDEQKALEGITILPARNLGVDDRVGSLETGKDADIVVWNYHPFHYLATPIFTMINGEIIYKKN